MGFVAEQSADIKHQRDAGDGHAHVLHVRPPCGLNESLRHGDRVVPYLSSECLGSASSLEYSISSMSLTRLKDGSQLTFWVVLEQALQDLDMTGYLFAVDFPTSLVHNFVGDELVPPTQFAHVLFLLAASACIKAQRCNILSMGVS